MKTEAKSKRYIVRDVRDRQYAGIGTAKRNPWQIIDTTTNQIVDELHSSAAAKATAKDMNKESHPE